MTETDAVELEIEPGGVAELRLNRPDRGNAMGRELLDAFAAAVARLQRDLSVRVVVVSGRGKHFCTGADLRDGVQALAADLGGGPAALRKAIRSLYDPFLSILGLEVPTIAAVHGAAIGGGFGLALACDIRIAGEGARFQANFARLGIGPGMAITGFLPRLIGSQHAAELLYTGRPISGREATGMGLALRAVPAERVTSEARALAEEIAASAPEAVRLTKAALRRASGFDLSAVADAEALAQAHCASLPDAAEGVAAWFERRPPRFTGR
ncbi:MAG TPA: enoyl-CoA hydratase-related protein [Myxococcales bacterium]|nr:enoyl-CoA hydratase-related protein [Myxococcales bacterium]